MVTEDITATELKIVERSLYAPILDLLQNLGFQGILEINSDDDFVDIYFKYEEQSFIAEIKIERRNKNQIINGIVQAYRYSLNEPSRTKNIISICYPNDVAGNIFTFRDVSDEAIKRRVECILLTENWYDYVTDLSVEEIFNHLKAKIDKKVLAAQNIQIASKTIQKAINQLSILINKSYGTNKRDIENLANFLGDYGLLLAFNRTKNEKVLRNQVIDLLAYILVNQILFYFLYAKKTELIPEIKEITQLLDLNDYFKQIRKINFKPIFDINVTSKILNTSEIVGWVNTIISCLTPLRIDELKQDLYGRLIGNSIPKETRKTLASYYTRTSSAELLVNLSIDEYNNTIWDLACGSGTILVSAYNRKLRLFEILKRDLTSSDRKRLHTIFLEKEITGADIMPFACHLAGLNLSAQNLDTVTNHMRIVNKNSLVLYELPIEVNEAYGDIYKELESIEPKQKTLNNFPKKEEEEEIKTSKIILEKVDRVLINPPFTRLENIPQQYRKTFNDSVLSDICGNRINLWGYFMSLADKVLQDGGKLGAIIPLNILRGDNTKKLRKYFLENYSIEYIIRPDFNLAFSEDTDFGDLIFIVKKNKPSLNYCTKIVCLKNDINHYSSVEIENLSSRIKIETDALSDSKDFLLRRVKQIELFENLQNLMPYFFTNNKDTIKIFDGLINKLESRAKEKLTTLGTFPIEEGFHASPAGLSELTFITRPYTEERIKRAFLILDDETDENLIVSIKDANVKFNIDKSDTLPALRTLTGIDTFFIDNKDYFIKNKPTDFDKLLALSKWRNKKEFSWDIITDKLKDKETYLAIARRFRPDSKNTYFFAFCHDNCFVSPHTFKIIKLDRESSKYQCLFLNSILGLLNVIMLREQTTEGYTDIMESDLKLFKAFNIEKLTEKDKKLLDKIFNELKNVKFPPILEQLDTCFDARMKLDKTILNILGFSDKEANEWIPKVYDAIVSELKAMKGAGAISSHDRT